MICLWWIENITTTHHDDDMNVDDEEIDYIPKKNKKEK